MKSYRGQSPGGSNCRASGLPGYRLAFLLLIALSVSAQTPGSIASQALPVSGFLSVIDGAGNVYFAGTTGPVSAGAPQTAGGGGTCYIRR
jgi:hypothetical protein